jgi:hypothetical protein
MDDDGVKLEDYSQQFSVIGISGTGSIHRNKEESLKGSNAK